MDTSRQQGPDAARSGPVRSRTAAPQPASVLDPGFAATTTETYRRISPAGMLAMQRLAGNRAVRQEVAPRMRAAARTVTPDKDGTPSTRSEESGTTSNVIELPSEGVVHPGAWLLDQPDVHGRMPTFKDLKAALTDRQLKIPESVIKDRVSELLGRMQAEKRLKSTDPVPIIVAKIFPGGGKISEVEFKKAIDVADRTRIYQSVLDADTKVKKEDRAKLRAAMKDAEALISQVAGDAVGLTQVFGTKDAIAKTRYAATRQALIDASANIDKQISTDYNLDADQVGLSGYASFKEKKMHLLNDVVKVVDPDETKITLIHEASHLSSPDVKDKGYYDASDGFAGMTEDEKIRNAAHFEELPRRVLGTSSFVGRTFTPGQGKGGKPLSRDDVVHRLADEYARQAWDAAVDCHLLMSEVRQSWLKTKSRAKFIANQPRLLEISKLIDLTIHTQAPAHARVTSLDVTLSESVARVVSQLTDLVAAEPVPLGPFSDQGAANAMVAAAVAKHGHLFGNPTRDKTVLDWMVAHVGDVF